MIFSEKEYGFVAKLKNNGMGTENVGPLLYSLVKIHRPKDVLAVGLGYSTAYIVKAILDVGKEEQLDRELMTSCDSGEGRLEVLNSRFQRPDDRSLTGIDNLSEDTGGIRYLQKLIDHMGFKRNFRMIPEDIATALQQVSKRFDFVWVDCGHQSDYGQIFNEVFARCSSGATVVFHYTYIDVDQQGEAVLVPGPFVNELKRQIAISDEDYEFISLVEPHKIRQGSVSIIRKMRDSEQLRSSLFGDEIEQLYGRTGPSPKLKSS